MEVVGSSDWTSCRDLAHCTKMNELEVAHRYLSWETELTSIESFYFNPICRRVVSQIPCAIYVRPLGM
jgi:hypothetical protein